MEQKYNGFFDYMLMSKPICNMHSLTGIPG